MRILFTGKSDFSYNRTHILRQGLAQMTDVEIIDFPIISRAGFDKAKFRELSASCDFVYIPPFRHRDVAFIKRLSKSPVVFDPLISKLLTKDDFGHFWKLPFKYLIDKIPFSTCDLLLADTQAHKDYFQQKFNITEQKIAVLPIGVPREGFYPQPKKTKTDQFIVGFYGSFVPLQGTDVIMKVAFELKDHFDIEFQIIGEGYRYPQARKLASELQLDRVHFLGRKAYESLNQHINEFDVCLGIFGDSDKADFVIPNKIYHYAAAAKCILSRDTRGIRELFAHDQNIVLCSTNPKEIAAQILQLKMQPEKRQTIGRAAAELINKHYDELSIARRFVEILRQYQAQNTKPL